MDEVWLGIGLDHLVDYTERSVLSRGASTIDKCNPVGLLVVYFIHPNFYQSFFKKNLLVFIILLYYFFFFLHFLSFSFVFLFSLISVQCGVLSVEEGGVYFDSNSVSVVVSQLFSTPSSHLIMRLFISTVLHEIEMGQLNQSLSLTAAACCSHTTIHAIELKKQTTRTNYKDPFCLRFVVLRSDWDSSGSICFFIPSISCI